MAAPNTTPSGFSPQLLILIAFALCAVATGNTWAAEQITLQLRWVHQFQFAGYYAALERGYYADAGLDVEIREAGPNRPTPMEELGAGNAHYGVGNSGLVAAYHDGAPVVALASIFQRSPNIWLTLESAQLDTPIKLASKRLMMTPSVENVELLSIFAKEGISQDRLTIVPSTFNVMDLINGKTDAFNAYVTNEPYLLEQMGIPFRIIDPHDYGIDFYSDVLFTTEDELNNHPERVAAFLKASLKGWRYAIDHPEEIIDLIQQRYNNEKTREHLVYEAKAIRVLMEPDLIEIGHMNPLRWQKISDTFVQLSMSKTPRPLEGFLYDPTPPSIPKWVFSALLSAIIVIAIGLLITLHIYRSNRQLKAAKQSLQASEERLSMALEAAKQGWFDLNLKDGSVLVSPEYPRMIGYEPDDFETDLSNWMANIHEEDRAKVGEAFQECLTTSEPKMMAYRRKAKSGYWIWVESIGKIVEWDTEGRPTRMIGIHTDITERKHLEHEIQELAFYDLLTGLPNRTLLTERLDLAIAAAKRTKRFAALIFLDLDNFKPLNDKHGHDVGDLLLIEVASRLKSCVREVDTTARFGGDEFIVILSALSEDKSTALEEANQIAEKISSALAIPYTLSINRDGAETSFEHPCTASIGVALFGNDSDEDRKRILRNADEAMYAAKNKGSGQIQLYSSN